jgi:enamine deaminase RidA (YjgF/YER057c/UK114 family)
MVKRIRKARIMHGAVEHNGLLFIGGHAAVNIDQGMEGQTREVCAKLDAVLAEGGSDKKNLLQARIYITDMSKKEEMNAAWLAWLADEDLPARATIGVADLGDPRRLIEVTAIAAVKDK